MHHAEPHDLESACHVTIVVDDRDGQTRATARLRLGDKESVGVGLSRLGPSERGVAGIGRELAVARALSDLSRHMMAVTAGDIESLTTTPAAPTR